MRDEIFLPSEKVLPCFPRSLCSMNRLCFPTVTWEHYYTSPVLVQLWLMMFYMFCSLLRPAMSIPYRLPWTQFLSNCDLWLSDQVFSSCFVFWSKISEALVGFKFGVQHPHQVFSSIFWNYAPIWEGTSLKFLCKCMGIHSLRKSFVSSYISVSQYMASIIDISVQPFNPTPLF